MDEYNDLNFDDFFANLGASSSRIGTDTLDPTTLEFVMSLGIDVEEFLNNKDNDFYSTSSINPIVSRYGVFDGVHQQVYISVADIVGHDNRNHHVENNGDNILHTFNSFF